MYSYPPLKVKVWGDYALFTQPEAKVERVSYPCMTPSAARGILEAIFWKPEFAWQVRRINVLTPITFDSIVRNEVGNVIAERTVKGLTYSEYCADEDRQQRHSLFLRNVAYTIEADIILKPYVEDNIAKYRDMFRRRVKRGQCFNQPYLGTRECMAFFAEVDDQKDQPVAIDLEIGSMLFDLKYPDENCKQKAAAPVFFQAELKKGTLEVPIQLYEVVNPGVYEATR